MIRIATLLIAATALAACGGGGSGAPAPLPITLTGWSFQYSPNMPAQPMPDGAGGVYFDFPSLDGVHYLLQPRTSPLTHSITIRAELVMSAGAQLLGSDGGGGCPPTPHVVPYFQRAGYQPTAAMQNYAWFAKYIDLLPGVIEATIPFVTDNWTQVFALHNATEFAASLSQPQAAGLVFGAGCFAGHGLYVGGGSARLYIRAFSAS